MAKSVIEDIKFEDGQSNLSQEQMNKIAEEALSEVIKPEEKDDWHNPADKEAAAEDKPKTEEEKTQEAEAKVAEDKKKEEDAAKAQEAEQAKVAEDKKKEEDAALKAKLEAETPEQKTAREAEEAKAKEFKIENRQKAIEELALKESLTLEEAEAQINKDEAIVNKYKNNPVEMAKALRQIQSYADKTKAELEATRKAATNPPAVVTSNIKDYIEQNLEPIKDKVIESFRKEYPEITDGQTDTYVYGLIKKDATDKVVKVMEEQKATLVSAAKEKRANLILNLPEQDKAFIPDIKAILDRTGDRQLMDKAFDLQYIVDWAKGKQLPRLIKEAEERGAKREREKAVVLGEKNPGSKTPAPSSSARKTTLSPEQQQRALDMFDSIPGMPDDEKFQAYIDTYPEEFKK